MRSVGNHNFLKVHIIRRIGILRARSRRRNELRRHRQRKDRAWYLPTYCPQANPIERAFGDVHDKWTRDHTRKRMWHLVQEVKQHLRGKGPWPYALSALYYTPEVRAAVVALPTADISLEASSQLAA